MRLTTPLLFMLCLCTPGSAQNPVPAVLFDGRSAPPWVRMMALTLAGIVNRDSPRLYLQNVYETWSYAQTDEQWADLYRTRGNTQFEVLTSDTQLVNRFRSFVRGGIRYDYTRTFGNFPGQSFLWQGEYAALIGALTDRLPLAYGQWDRYRLPLEDSVLVTDPFDGDPPVWVPGKLDTLTAPWNNPALTTEEDRYLTMLDWGVRVLLPRCNPSRLYIREITDFAVQQRMFQINLAGTHDLKIDSIPPARFDIIERSVSFLHAKNPATIFHIYGWIRPEPLTQWFAYFGASFHETLTANISWHSAFPAPPAPFARASLIDPDTVVVQPRTYLLFLSSEGDAANWVLSFQSGAWLSPQRGRVPIGWGWNLHLLDLMPFVARYYNETATAADGFVSVLTPLGFSYPDYWQDDVLPGAIDSSRALMDRFRVTDIYGYKHYEGTGAKSYRGKLITDDFLLDRYARFQYAIGATSSLFFNSTPSPQRPAVYGNTLLLNHKGDGSFYGDVVDLPAAAARIVAAVKLQPKPGFLLAGYQRFRHDTTPIGSLGSADMTVARLDSLIRLITADPIVGNDIEVVTPERFSALMRKHTGMLSSVASAAVPAEISLEQNYPNPFNPATRIRFTVGRSGGETTAPPATNGVLRQETINRESAEAGSASMEVRLAVYDLLGREVAVLVDGLLAPGSYETTFAASGLASGVYFSRLTVQQRGMYPRSTAPGSRTATRTMVLVR